MSRPQPKSIEICAEPRVVWRAHVLHAGHRADRLLDRPRDHEHRLVRRATSCLEVDDDARKRHLGEQADREDESGGDTRERQRERDGDDRLPLAFEQIAECHQRADVRTVSPSATW